MWWKGTSACSCCTTDYLEFLDEKLEWSLVAWGTHPECDIEGREIFRKEPCELLCVLRRSHSGLCSFALDNKTCRAHKWLLCTPSGVDLACTEALLQKVPTLDEVCVITQCWCVVVALILIQGHSARCFVDIAKPNLNDKTHIIDICA